MCRFSAAVREFAARTGAPPLDANSTVEVLLFRNDVLQTRLNAIHQELLKLRQEKHAAECKAARLEIELSGLPGWAKRFSRWLSKK
jgi:hypothetical protein